MQNPPNVTFAFVLRVQKTRTDGKAPVYLRRTENRQVRYQSTGVLVEPAYWDAGAQRVVNCPAAEAFNFKLEVLLLCARTGFPICSEDLDSRNLKVSTLITARINQLRQSQPFWPEKRYATLRHKLFAAVGDIAVSQVNQQAIETFIRHQEPEWEGKEIMGTTAQEVGRLRAVLATAKSAGLTGSVSLKVPKRKDSDNHVVLDIEQMCELSDVNLAWGTMQRNARDAFLLAFYGAGVRVSDLCLLGKHNLGTERNSTWLHYQRMTDNAEISVPLPPVVLPVLAPYLETPSPLLFSLIPVEETRDPYLIRRRIAGCTTQLNRAIKQVAARAGLDHASALTMDAARLSARAFVKAHRSAGAVKAAMRLLGFPDTYATSLYFEAASNSMRRPNAFR